MGLASWSLVTDVFRHGEGDVPCSHPAGRLWVLARCRGIGLRQHVAEAGHDHRARRIEAAVQKHRAENSFERVGENGRAIGATALQLSFTQLDFAPQSERSRDPRQRVLIDERRADARQITFGQRTKALEQRNADDAVEHRIADEFEPFVVGYADAAVGERLAKQVGLAKRVPELCSQRGGHPVARRAYRDAEASNSSRRLTLLTSGRIFCQLADAVTTLPLLVTATSFGVMASA